MLTEKREIQGLRALVKDLVQDDITSREQFHEWKRSHADRLTTHLDYRRQEGMPDVTQIIAPHFHETLPLIGLNYTPAAGVSLHHYERGWSPTLSLCRGIVFDRGADLVARPFPKFFNFGERLGDWGDGDPEVSVKEDGHLIIVFRYGNQIIVKTRGDFNSPTARIARQMVKQDLAPNWQGMDVRDVTLLCELIHPDTKVGVDYGDRRALILVGLYDNISQKDLAIDELRKAGDAFGLEVVRQVEMTRPELMAVINGGGNNSEGFVARWPDGHRVKFKYGAYMEEMRERKEEARAEREPLAGVGRRVVDRAVVSGPSYLRTPVRDGRSSSRMEPVRRSGSTGSRSDDEL